LLFTQIDTKAQKLSAGFNSTHSGRSLSATYSIEKKNHEIGFGLGFNINQNKHNDDQENLYLKRLYASEFIQYFAFKGFYHRTINLNIENVKPYFFYDLQVRYSKTRNRSTRLPNIPDTAITNNPGQFFFPGENVKQYGPFTWVEQTIGLGFDIQLNERFFLRQKFGVETNFILGRDDQIRRLNWFDWEFGALYNIEVGYQL